MKFYKKSHGITNNINLLRFFFASVFLFLLWDLSEACDKDEEGQKEQEVGLILKINYFFFSFSIKNFVKWIVNHCPKGIH